MPPIGGIGKVVLPKSAKGFTPTSGTPRGVSIPKAVRPPRSVVGAAISSAPRAVRQQATAAKQAHDAAYESFGAVKGQRAFKASQPHVGLGLSQRQAALELLGQAKSAQSTGEDRGTFITPLKPPKSSGGGGLLASILDPAAGAIKAIGSLGVVKNLGNDVVNLPSSTLQSMEQLGGAAWDDISHGRFGSANLGTALGTGKQTELESTVSRAAKQDALVNLLTGHPGRALTLAGQHPLGAILDATGAYGVAGKAAGAFARAGLAGDTAARYASAARAPRELADGIPGTAAVRHYSPNLATATVQKALDEQPALRTALRNARGAPITDRLGLTGDPRALRQQAALVYGTEKSRIAKLKADTAKALKEAKPKSKTEANVVPYIAAFGGGTDTLQHLHDLYTEAKAGVHGPLTPANQHMLDQHIANLHAALDKPNLDMPAIQHAADVYREQQGGFEQAKTALGLNDQAELSRALEKQYALARIPGTHYMTKPVIHPDSIAERRAAGAALREATNNLKVAQDTAARSQGAHAGASRAVADASRRLPLDPVNDNLQSHLLDLRDAIEQTRAEHRTHNGAVIDALKDHLDTAQQEYKLAKEHPKMLGGAVIEDPAARPVVSGPWKGMQLRGLTSEDVTHHLDQTGDHPAYVRMTNPERERPFTFPELRSEMDTKGSATGKVNTGRAAATGDWTPGYPALIRSQLHDVFKTGNAQLEQTFLKRFGLKDPEGNHFTPHNWEHAAAEYEARTGTKVVPVADRAAGNDKIVLMPKTAAKELKAQNALERPTAVGRFALRANRAFRNTVLPMSPKLPIMHTVENVSRGLLAGASPFSYGMARSVLEHMPEDAANRLRDLATPGGMGGHQASLDEEDLGRLNSAAKGPVRKAAGAPARGWANVAHHIIAFQRAIERHTQTAALGIHMRKTLQEWGHSWADANTHVSAYADELAKGYSDPALAEDAAKYVHQTMGQYNNFTARQRAFISRVAPFSPWYVNAAKLVYKGLPVRHPLKSAMIQDVAHANSAGWQKTHAGLPADLKSAVNIGPGHLLDVGKLTPVGLEKPSLAEVGSLIAPQWAGAAAALTGHDPFWADFKGPHTAYGKNAIAPFSTPGVLQAIDQLGQSFAGPVGSLARVIEEHGATPYNTSLPLFGKVQLKPNTQHGPANLLGGLNRVFNPFAGVWYSTTAKGPGLGSIGRPKGGIGKLKGSIGKAGAATTTTKRSTAGGEF